MGGHPREVIGPIVYRLGRHSFKVQRGVRLPLGLLWAGHAVDDPKNRKGR